MTPALAVQQARGSGALEALQNYPPVATEAPEGTEGQLRSGELQLEGVVHQVQNARSCREEMGVTAAVALRPAGQKEGEDEQEEG